MDMFAWLAAAPGQGRPLPILSFPGRQITGVSVARLVRSADAHADCLVAVAERWEGMAASVSLMDLSVEAEAFGAEVRVSDDEVPTVVAPVVDEDDERAARLRAPAVGDGRTGVYVEAAAKARARLPRGRPLFAGAIGPFSLAARLMDMNEIMVRCLVAPDQVHAVLEKASAFLAGYYRAFRDAGADGLVMAEPAAGLLSPALIETFSTAYVRRLIAEVQTPSFLVVYHNCGPVTKLLDGVVGTGAKALHFGNAVPLADILARLPGDRVALGNVDPAGELRHGTPASVARATEAVLAACGGYPNFVLSTGCDVPPQAPMANLDAFFAAAAAAAHRAANAS